MQRLDGGLEIQVEPVYNFFLDTMPPYENVTANVPEYILPNFYVFETELRNTNPEVTLVVDCRRHNLGRRHGADFRKNRRLVYHTR